MAVSTATRTINHFIDGAAVDEPSARYGDVYDPARGIVQARVAFADAEMVDRAVRAAASAFPAWRATPLGKRSELLFAFRELLRANAQRFAQIVSSEHGKIVTDAAGEVARALEVVDYACALTQMT
ncbi:MAG: aldehyde dehydrogenase family protein, partial [Candidatus Aquilonibacter sp.]